jgi:CHAT domain-containing protein
LNKFYEDWLAPSLKGLNQTKIIVVPHGVMHKVPFSSLFDGHNFLNDRFEVSVIPSISVIEYLSSNRKNEKSSLLAFGNPKTGFSDLEFAEKEVRLITPHFTKNRTYFREHARESQVKDSISGWNVVHFACHGEFSEKQPFQSGLFLTPDEMNDGFFQVHEIFSLNLSQANLVTLSACETGLGRVVGGDDLVGLALAFMYAGAPSILASLWDVDDGSTAILMSKFYHNWIKNNMSKSESLRRARLSLKEIPEYSHPFFWAAFQLIGDWQ